MVIALKRKKVKKAKDREKEINRRIKGKFDRDLNTAINKQVETLKKKNYSYKASTKKSREKRRKIRAEAKAAGKPISLSESKRQAGGIEAKALSENERRAKSRITEAPKREKVQKLTHLNPNTSTKKKGVLGDLAVGAKRIFGDIPAFKKLRDEGRLLTGTVPLGPNFGAISGGVKGVDSLFKGADSAINQIVSTVRSDMGGGVLGTYQLNAALGSFGGQTNSALAKLGSHVPSITVRGQRFAINKLAGTSFARVANNAKNFALKKTFLQKLAGVAKDPRVVLGIIASTVYTSLFWAPNEKGDALTTLTIAQNLAVKNENVEMVREIGAQIEEVQDITAQVPIIGFLQAEWAKFKAAATASRAAMDEADKIAAKQAEFNETGETDFQKERRESDEAAFDRKREFAEEEADRFEKIRQDRDAEDLRRAQISQEMWRLRGLGGQANHAKADALELSLYQ